MFEKLTNCPLCNRMEFQNFIVCKDYTVSQESFAIVSCNNCGFKFTNPRPTNNSLSNYYQSDNYISHSNSKKGLINITYQIARKFNIRSKLKLINKIVPKKGKLLDYGCGTGEFLASCQKNGWIVDGVEPSSTASAQASQIINKEIYPDIFNQFPNQKYNVITLWHVLEHIPELNKTFKKIKSHLDKKGIIIVAVPNYNSYDAKYFKEKWIGYDVPRHLYHFDQSTMKMLAKNMGMKITKIFPLKLDAYYASLLSLKNIDGGSNYLKAIKIGRQSNNDANINNNNYSSLIYVLNIHKTK